MRPLPLPGRRVHTICATFIASLLASALTSHANPLDDPCRDRVACTVAVEGLPASSLASGEYELAVSGAGQQPLPGDGLATVQISGSVTVRLVGAAYEGELELSPKDCEGEAVHVLAATVKPARLLFQAGAVAPAELIVSCVAGCPYENKRADRFPVLPFGRGQTEAVVELSFKARGHRSTTAEFKLSPGDNVLRVTMEPLG